MKSASSSHASLGYRPDIDGLRALAVLGVVAFHAFPGRLTGGFVGVDVFFVISGFLISSIIFGGLGRGDFSFREFYARRIRRIFPALILVLAASYAFGWVALLGSEFRQLTWHIVGGAGFFSNFVLQGEIGYFDTLAETKPLLHLWSLAVEEQFYLIWPVLLWGCYRWRLKALWVIGAVALLSFGWNLSSIYLGGLGYRSQMAMAFYSPQTRFWELMLGAILARVMVERADWINAAQRAAADIMALAGVGLIALSMLMLTKAMPFPDWWALMPTVGAVLVIAAGAGAWVNRVVLSSRVVVFVGLISYPLYLWHWPLLVFVRLLVNDVPSATLRVGAVALAFVLAVLTYWLIERPVRFGGWRRLKTVALVVLMMGMGALGYHGTRAQGYPFHKPETDVSKLYQGNPMDPARDVACDKRFPQFAAYHRCRLSKDSAEPELVVIGDSHSGHYFNRMAQLWPTQVVMNVAWQMCLPFSGGASEECANAQAGVYRFVEQQRSVKTVYLAGFWHHLMVGGFKHELDGGGVLMDVDYNRMRTFQALGEKIIGDLLNSGKRVVLILDNPNLDFNPRSCIPHRPIRALEKVVEPCAMDRKVFELKTAEYERAIVEIAAKFPRLVVVDAKKVLCDREYCWAKKDETFLYYDRHHLSAHGAELVIRTLPH